MLILLLNQIVSLFLVQFVDAVLVLLQVEPQDGVDVSATVVSSGAMLLTIFRMTLWTSLLIYTHCRV